MAEKCWKCPVKLGYELVSAACIRYVMRILLCVFWYVAVAASFKGNIEGILIITVSKRSSPLTSRASSTSSLWSGWTRCLRAHRACCTIPCWWCARTSRAAPASAAAWGPVFLEGSPCTINTCTTTATWTLRRLVGLFYLILFSSTLFYSDL